MDKHPHILSAASNLLGISLVIITGLNVSGIAKSTIADEVAWVSAVLLSLSCLLSYSALRSERHRSSFEAAADQVFLGGLVALFASVLVLALR